MAEKITLKNALANLPQKTDVDSIVAKDASGNPVFIKKSDLAQVVAELMSSSKLYPFMNRGVFNDESMIYDLNTFTQSGTFLISASLSENSPISSGVLYLSVFDFSYSNNIRTVQILCTQSSFYFRTMGTTGWSEWKKL